MSPEEFTRRVRANAAEIARMVRDTAPRVVGVKAVGFFKENYVRGGYQDGGFHAWKKTRRQTDGVGAARKYTPLTSKRNRLFNRIKYRPMAAAVEIYDDAEPYARIHNEGGTTHPTVTPRMKRYFWRMYFEAGGKDSGDRAEFYKGMALQKVGKVLNVVVPQRKYIYHSPEVDTLVVGAIRDEIKKIILR